MKSLSAIILLLYCASGAAQSLTQTPSQSSRIAEIEARLMPHLNPTQKQVTPETAAFQSGYPNASYDAALNCVGPGSGIGPFGDIGGPDVAPRPRTNVRQARRRDQISMLGGTRIGEEYPGDAPPAPGYGANIASPRGKSYITEGLVDPYEGSENLYLRGE